MSTLHISLDEGFHGHSVVIFIGAHQVYQERDVTTDLRISRAAAFDAEVAPGLAQVNVRVEPGGLVGNVDIDTIATPYLSIAIDPSGAIVFRPCASMPRYM